MGASTPARWDAGSTASGRREKGKQSALRCAVCAMALPPFSHYFWHGDWQDTITLLAGLLDDATTLLRHIQAEPDDIFHQMANVATRCLGRARAVAPKVAKQVVDTAGQAWLETLREHRPLDATALQALARGRHKRWSAQVCAWMGLGLKDENRGVRCAAIKTLDYYPIPEALAVLHTAFRDTDEVIRKAAVETLAQHFAPEALAVLHTALQDTAWQVRQAAVKALAQHPTLAVLAVLHTALQDTDPYVREAAARALAQYPAPEALAVLHTALQHTDGNVRRTAARALRQHPTSKVLATLHTALQHIDGSVREAAIEALAQYPIPEAIATLHTALGHTAWGVHRAAAQALAQHSTSEARAALRTALQHRDEVIRRVAVEALGKTQDKDAVSPLLAIARHEKQGNVWEALWRLSQRAKIWIDTDGQWHLLPPVEPAFQNVTGCQQVTSFWRAAIQTATPLREDC